MGFDKDFSPVLRFMVCSDVHIKDFPSPERERFKKAILTSYDLASSQPYPRLDAVYVVGDFANSGTPLQMNVTKQIIDETVKGDTVFNLSVASHEFGYNGEIMAKKRLKRIFGNEASTHRVINGFHFISIGCTRGCLFDEPQRDFLRKSLCEAAA
ncbi:MAG: hypothetical protein K6B52_04425, partial [Clostridiales bacterium]|nr:hypothetical protein [Clostridiales bacterium]